ncbi:MAG: PTS sugar transporter subunit IIC [Ruminococcaceae bacterium]|nr:PTS sugar transporter subunit IIC [Oscillospiraceae bacterium]
MKKDNKFVAFLKRKGVSLSLKKYFVDAFSAMAMGLFASLLIGTIFGTIGTHTNIEFFNQMSEYCKAVQGSAMAVSIGCSLGANGLVLFSLCVVGHCANGFGGPLGVFVITLLACEIGKIVSKETKIDILVTPTVIIAIGTALSLLIGPAISYIMAKIGGAIMSFTVLQPFLMGILVSVTVGIALTLPISSAAICASIGLVGLAGGAAVAGCCAQMVGFAVMSFKENKWGGLVAQGLGTSMLQMGNICKNPLIWIPATLASAITGPIATCIFKLEIPEGNAVASGMGTCGMVGPIGLMSNPGFGSWFDWVGLLLVCIVLPAILSFIFSETLRKIGWIRENDLKLEL